MVLMCVKNTEKRILFCLVCCSKTEELHGRLVLQVVDEAKPDGFAVTKACSGTLHKFVLGSLMIWARYMKWVIDWAYLYS